MFKVFFDQNVTVQPSLRNILQFNAELNILSSYNQIIHRLVVARNFGKMCLRTCLSAANFLSPIPFLLVTA